MPFGSALATISCLYESGRIPKSVPLSGAVEYLRRLEEKEQQKPLDKRQIQEEIIMLEERISPLQKDL
jgi:hypothetical protein